MCYSLNVHNVLYELYLNITLKKREEKNEEYPNFIVLLLRKIKKGNEYNKCPIRVTTILLLLFLVLFVNLLPLLCNLWFKNYKTQVHMIFFLKIPFWGYFPEPIHLILT